MCMLIQRFRQTCGVMLMGAVGLASAQAPVPDAAATAAVVRDVAAKIGRVSGFSATVESAEQMPDDVSANTTVGTLTVSRLYGWKMSMAGMSPYTMVTDFHTMYQHLAKERRVIKTTADSPELKAMMVKPVSDMNPVALLDPQSIRFLGEEILEGETVYHVEGTTQSQFMPGGPLVNRRLSAWLSAKDGLPRKTVESVGATTGTTVYRDVKINPELKPEDFAFTPPAGVTVIDTNEQIRKIEERMGAGRTTGTEAP